MERELFTDLQEALLQPYRAIFAYGGMILCGVEIRVVILPARSLFDPAQVVVMYTTWKTYESGEKRMDEPKFEHCPFETPEEAQAIVERVCPTSPKTFTVFQ